MAACRLALFCRGLSVCPIRHNPFSQKHLPFLSLRRDWLRLTRLGPTGAGSGDLAGPRSSLPRAGNWVRLYKQSQRRLHRRPRDVPARCCRGGDWLRLARLPPASAARPVRPIDVGTDWVRLAQCVRATARRPAPISVRVGRLGSFRTIGSRVPAGLLRIGFVCTDGIGLESRNDGMVGRWGISSAGNWLRFARILAVEPRRSTPRLSTEALDGSGRNQDSLSPRRQERRRRRNQICVFPLAVFASLRET